MPRIERQAEDLGQMARDINGLHRRVKMTQGELLVMYRQIGEKLIAAKKLCGHGKWEKWCRENLEFNQATACRYMRFAKSVSDTDLTDEQWDLWQGLHGHSGEDSSLPSPRPRTNSDVGWPVGTPAANVATVLDRILQDTIKYFSLVSEGFGDVDRMVGSHDWSNYNHSTRREGIKYCAAVINDLVEALERVAASREAITRS